MSDLFTWRDYFQDQMEQREKFEFYASMLIAEMRRSYSKNPSKIKPKDFLFTFTTGDDTGSVDAPMTKEDAAAWSKARWGAWLKTDLG